MKKLTVIGLLVVLAGCYNDKADKLYPVLPAPPGDPCDTTGQTVSYTSTVYTIMQSNCAVSGCHDAAGSAGGYNLSSYSGVKKAADNGTLLGTIQYKAGYSPMPQGASQLPTCTIAKIQKWVNQGAPQN